MPQRLLNMLITNFNQLLKKSHRTFKIQPIFLGKLAKLTLFQSTHTLSLDVKALRINIPNAEGIKSVKTSLENYS